MLLFRIARAVFASEIWTGEGAWRHGARWNHRRTRIVYTSPSLALAAVEFFVNLDPNLSPDDLLACSGELPSDAAFAALNLSLLPSGWNRSRPELLQAMGDAWVQKGTTAALRVPSAAIAGEFNVLLNPAHPDFARFRPLPPAPFRFDPRMFSHKI